MRLGLLHKREIWIPTKRGWVAILLGSTATVLIIILGIHPFLAVNHPIGGEYLVVEGWQSERELKAAISIFRSGKYSRIITTGGIVHPDSYLKLRYPKLNSTAEVAAALLVEAGLSENLVTPVTRRKVTKDRTYHSALAVRRWLEDTQSGPAALDILSLGPHSRRSWLLFRLGLGEKINVGIIAQANLDYDPNRWWASSAGVRTVIGESLAFCYAKFLFYPEYQ